ncbi:MAG: alpha/beta hydrolase-fold protein [Chitinophagaceae bacterium]|jgi:predicted alpha/beta superfamily hydrolase|nr:alpha/beta hydrolase-fold protein [Chitinophagaceae bacterium]
MKHFFSKHTGLLIWGCLCAFSLSAQRVVFRLGTLPAGTKGPVYLAGSFNGWSPADPAWRLQPGDSLIRHLGQPGAIIQMKCTLGSWQQVEQAADGADMANRTFRLNSDTTVTLHIAAFRPGGANAVVTRPRTASAGVAVFDSAFGLPSLGVKRMVRMYLPPDYHRGNKRYPVLYMFDGQNLFDEATASFGEWRVDESLDSIFRKTGKGVIVIGIDHAGPQRINEYNPLDSSSFGLGYGEKLISDVVNVLKPAVDRRLKTRVGRRHTWVAGSSMGALMATYSMLHVSGTFGAAGVLSPAFWINTSLPAQVAAWRPTAPTKKLRWFFYAGDMESKEMVPDMERIARMVDRKNERTAILVVAQARHEEAFWASAFTHFIPWLLAR